MASIAVTPSGIRASQATVAQTGSLPGHLLSTGAVPLIAAGGASGTAAVVGIGGTDACGIVSIVPGAGADNSDDLAVVTFNAPYTLTPRVLLSPSTSAAALTDFYADNITVNGFGIHVASVPGPGLPGMQLAYTYLVIGTP